MKPSSGMWGKVLWSDETKIKVFGHNQDRENKWGTQAKEHPPHSEACGGRIMLWGCFFASDSSCLIRIRGILNAKLYKEILDEKLSAFAAIEALQVPAGQRPHTHSQNHQGGVQDPQVQASAGAQPVPRPQLLDKCIAGTEEVGLCTAPHKPGRAGGLPRGRVGKDLPCRSLLLNSQKLLLEVLQGIQ